MLVVQVSELAPRLGVRHGKPHGPVLHHLGIAGIAGLGAVSDALHPHLDHVLGRILHDGIFFFRSAAFLVEYLGVVFIFDTGLFSHPLLDTFDGVALALFFKLHLCQI